MRVAHTVLLKLLRKARRVVGLEVRKGQEVNAAELCSELVFLVRVVHENLFRKGSRAYLIVVKRRTDSMSEPLPIGI